jgi:hypothetical protein
MKYVFFAIVSFLYVQCTPVNTGTSEPRYEVIEVKDIQELDLIKEYKRQHRGYSLYYVVKEGKAFVHDGMVTTAIEVIQPHGWAKVGNSFSESVIDSLKKLPQYQ